MQNPDIAYKTIASHLRKVIESNGMLQGEKMPSVRQIATTHQVSPPTAERALRELEAQGLIVAKPRSGFYVCEQFLQPVLRITAIARPRRVTLTAQVHEMFALVRSPDLVALGAASPFAAWLPTAVIARSVAVAYRRLGDGASLYSIPPGRLDLRRQIARRARRWDGHLAPDNLIVTSGATQATHIALLATTKSGDTVAVESPCYFGTLMLLKACKLKAIEIPTHFQNGIDLNALSLALKTYEIKVVIATPTANNPLGFTMSVPNKKRLVSMLAKTNTPLIEDDIYGELTATARREPPCKAFDEKGLVLYCSSVSKTLSPGLRLGWIEPGQFYEAVLDARVEASLAGSPVPEAALAEMMLNGDYDRHLRRFTERTNASLHAIAARIAANWPVGTTVTQPSAGYLLWVELPVAIDAQQLQKLALERNASICPGAMFSVDGKKFSNCLRINCALPATPQLLGLIDHIGQIAQSLL
jgi:DNA-binding transcriptional MocR family regulator